GLAIAASACSENHGAGLDQVLAADRAPAVLGRFEQAQRRFRERLYRRRNCSIAECNRDRESGPVTDLEQTSAGGATAFCEPIAAVLARELHPELFEPADRPGSLGRQHLDQVAIGRLVRTLPDVRGVLLGRVVVAEGSLDPTLRF